MRILKIKGNNEESLRKQVEKEYGNQALILSVEQQQEEGIFKWLKRGQVVLTVAIKEEEHLHPTQQIHNQSDAYNILVKLKEEMSELHQQIRTLHQTPPQMNVHKDEGRERQGEDRTLVACMKDKLTRLGVNDKECSDLFSNITHEESEAIIRKLYKALEEKLKEKEETFAKVIFFVGSTGVGKTTTLAKLTAKYVLEEHKKVVLFTSDTYRIAAVEQLRTYADILGVSLEVIYNESELPHYIDKWKHMDHILIDTAGRSHKNEEQLAELKGLIQPIQDKQIYLVLNGNISERDAKKIIITYQSIAEYFELIITKLDETDEIGNMVNISCLANQPIRYITNGQNVPSDIKKFNRHNYITELLGRLNGE